MPNASYTWQRSRCSADLKGTVNAFIYDTAGHCRSGSWEQRTRPISFSGRTSRAVAGCNPLPGCEYTGTCDVYWQKMSKSPVVGIDLYDENEVPQASLWTSGPSATSSGKGRLRAYVPPDERKYKDTWWNKANHWVCKPASSTPSTVIQRACVLRLIRIHYYSG